MTLTCTRCDKRLSRKTARQIDGKSVCSPCMFGQSPKHPIHPLYDSIVHGLRSRGWSRIDAESEALDRIEALRERERERAARDSDGTRSAETACPAPVPQDCQARAAESGIARPSSVSKEPPHDID